MTCEEVLDKEDESWYQRAMHFLPADGEVILEEINMAAKAEIADMDPFAGLYWIDAAMDLDDAYPDNEPDTDVPVDTEPEGYGKLGVVHGDGYHHQPPTIPDAWLALADLEIILYPQRQKQTGSEAKYETCKTPLDPITRAWLDDIQIFLWQYCDFNADGKPQNVSAGSWIQASMDIVGSETKGSWQAQILQASTREYIQTQELPMHDYGKRKSHINDEELSDEIQIHLQSVGKYACAQDIVEFSKDNNVQK